MVTFCRPRAETAEDKKLKEFQAAIDAKTGLLSTSKLQPDFAPSEAVNGIKQRHELVELVGLQRGKCSTVTTATAVQPATGGGGVCVSSH